MFLKDEFLYKWAEVSGFDFRKLLEDNQEIFRKNYMYKFIKEYKAYKEIV